MSPWKRPLGKIPLSSASMWLNIRDNLVRLRLQRITEREIFFRKVTKTGRKQHPLHLQKQLSPKTPTRDCFSGVHPAPRTHPAHGADQQGRRFLGHFPPQLPCRTSLRQPGYFQGYSPPSKGNKTQRKGKVPTLGVSFRMGNDPPSKAGGSGC